MTTTLRPYRHIEFLHGACPVCDEVHPLTDRHPGPIYTNKYGVRTRGFHLPKHGPRDERCEGSHQPPVPWVEASGLPGWDELSDLDKGAALMHVWKRKNEGGSYARENYPARYLDADVLRGLGDRDACRHASVVTGTWNEVHDRIGSDEVFRLYELALAYDGSDA